MAIGTVKEIWEGRSGSGTEEYTRTYARVWRVSTTDPRDGPTLVANAPGIPVAGYDFYVDQNGNVDVAARCVRVSADQDQDDPKLWLVKAEFSTSDPEKTKTDPKTQNENPLLRPPEISISFVDYKKALRTDAYGAAVLNSAGDPFDPPLEVDDRRLVIKHQKNVPLFDLAQAVAFQDTTNNDVFLGCTPGQVKCRSYTGERGFENSVKFWKRTIELEFCAAGFTIKVLDCGYQVLTGFAGAVKATALDARGQPYSSPVPLNGNGQALAFGAAPVFLPYDGYLRNLFAQLGIEAEIILALTLG